METGTPRPSFHFNGIKGNIGTARQRPPDRCFGAAPATGTCKPAPEARRAWERGCEADAREAVTDRTVSVASDPPGVRASSAGAGSGELRAARQVYQLSVSLNGFFDRTNLIRPADGIGVF